MEIGITDFEVWHHAGQGVPDPEPKRMGFFITTSEAQTLLEFDLSRVSAPRTQTACILVCFGVLSHAEAAASRHAETGIVAHTRRASAHWMRTTS